MKKNDVLLILATALYSLLFYRQSFGLNFLLFSIVLVVLLLLQNKSLIKHASWYVLAIGSIVSGVCVMLYGTWLAFAANITSLSLMSAMSFSKGSSIIMAGIYSLYSYVSAAGFMIVDLIERRGRKNANYGGKFWIKLSIGIGIFAVLVLFFFLYQKSNPLFKDLTEKINLDFISWPWVRFTLLGFVLLYGFFYSRNFPRIYRWDISIHPLLDEQKYTEKGNRIFGKNVNENGERISGIILIGLLNVLLLVVNILDIIYLWITKSLPSGMTFAEYLHQGTGTLVLSILLAILIILFYFRGALNFNKENKSLKMLVYLWLAQNAFVIVSTGYRNLLYISEYSLTYKRLGVYIWLVLTLVGLITTFVKIYSKRNNLYLFKSNGWSVYFVLILFACFNWDMVITKFNVQHSRHIDNNYLVELRSPANLPYLLMTSENLKEEESNNIDEEEIDSHIYVDRMLKHKNYKSTLHKRLFDFLDSRNRTGWQSWNYTAYSTEQEIYNISEKGGIPEIYLNNQEIESLEALRKLHHINNLNASSNKIQGLACLSAYDDINTLDISSNEFFTLDSIPAFKKLSKLDVSNNHILSFDKITKFPVLEHLSIAQNPGVIDFTTISKSTNLTHLDISNNSIKNIATITSLKKLKYLKMSAMEGTSAFDQLPVIENLETIDLSDNNFDLNQLSLLSKFKNFVNLKTVNLSGNRIASLFILTDADYGRHGFLFSWETQEKVLPVFPKLEDLNVSSNQVTSLEGLRHYPGLKRLDVSSNSISNFDAISAMKSLEYLNLSDTRFNEIETFYGLMFLKELNLSKNDISDLQKMPVNSAIEKLDLSENNISSLNGLENLKKLKELDVRQNRIEDLTLLKSLKNLEVLDISDNSVVDYSQLYSLKQLKKLVVSEIDLATYNLLRENLPNTLIDARYIRKNKRD